MPKAKRSAIDSTPMMPPALTPEGRENQLIAYATNLAEKQLIEGTASSQVICHYLKLAATKEKDNLEKQRMEEEIKLLTAKTEALQSAKNIEALYAEAIDALKTYSGHEND